MTWNKNVPADNEFGSKFPAQNQANMAALEDALAREHVFPGVLGSTAGKGVCSAKAGIFVIGAATPVIGWSYNVASVSRVSTGVFKVTFTDPLTAGYIICGMGSMSVGNYVTIITMIEVYPPTTADCHILVTDILTQVPVDPNFWGAVFVGA